MSTPVDRLIRTIVQNEGGYVDHPADKGGPTNHGITQRTLARWRGRPVTRDDVRALPLDEAVAIYRAQYVEGPGFDRLPEGLAPVIADFGVMAGPDDAVRLLQRVLAGLGEDVAVDGRLGPFTRAAAERAVKEHGLAEVVRRCVVAREAFHFRRVEAEPSQAVFLKGWLARARRFLLEAARA